MQLLHVCFRLLTFTLRFLLFTWISFVSCNIFVYGSSLSRTPLKMKLLVSKDWFVLVNLNTSENSTTSSFKDVQGSTIFWFLYLMIMNLVYWKHLWLASSPAYNVLLKISWKSFIFVSYILSLLVYAHPFMFCAFPPGNTKMLQCTFPSMSWMLFLHSLSWHFACSAVVSCCGKRWVQGGHIKIKESWFLLG